jgi:hypothetical protein
LNPVLFVPKNYRKGSQNGSQNGSFLPCKIP